MLLANFNRKEHLRHRAVSLRQHGFLVFKGVHNFDVNCTVWQTVHFQRFNTRREKKMVNGKWLPIALERVSIALALSTALTHARSESINADSLNSNFLPPHPVTCQHCDTHTTLVGLEPATFRSLVDHWSDALPVGLPVVPPHVL